VIPDEPLFLEVEDVLEIHAMQLEVLVVSGVVVPRNANAARSSSPATTAENTMFAIPSAAPTFWSCCHVRPLSWLTAARGVPELS
jgi:hypothetical protein